MQFQVPQFIEVEAKIFGPLTLKQFIYLAGGGAAVFLLYVLLPFFLFIVFAVPVVGFFVALAFYKVHNKSLLQVIENAFNYFSKAKIYTWKKEEKKAQAKKTKEISTLQEKLKTPTLTKSKLKDLSWSLDIKKKI